MKKTVALLVMAASIVAFPATAGAKAPPKSCVQALSAAEDIISLNAEFITAVGDYIGSVADSAQRNSAGTITAVTQFLRDQTAAIDTLTSKTKELTPDVSAARQAYEQSSTKCRSGK